MEGNNEKKTNKQGTTKGSEYEYYEYLIVMAITIEQ